MKRIGLLALLLWAGLASAQTQMQNFSAALSPAGTDILTVAQQATAGQYSPTNVNCIVGSPNWCGAKLTLAQLQTFICGGPACAGSGTVTSVGLQGVGILSFSGGPITSAGTINAVFVGTSGGVPYFDGTTYQPGNLLPTNQLLLGGGAGNGPFGQGSLGTVITVLHGNATGAPAWSAVNLGTDVTGTTGVPNGGTGVTSITGIVKGNGTANFSAALFSDFSALLSGSPSSSTFARGDGTWATPSGAGTVTTTGSPTTGNLACFSGATSIANCSITGDVAFAGSAATVGSIGGHTISLGGSFSTTGAFSVGLVATSNTTATLPAGTFTVGYLNIPQNAQSSSYSGLLTDQGKHVYFTTGTNTFTIPANSSVAYPIGTTLTIVNCTTCGNLTVAITSDTLIFDQTNGTGSRTIAAGGKATALKITSTSWNIGGANIT